jgi:hypothetical protein
MTWKDVKALLDGEGKRRGPRDSLRITNNTWLERGRKFKPPMARSARIGSKYRDGYSFVNSTSGDVWNAAGTEDDYPYNAIGLRYYGTYIVIWTPHWVELNSGGWPTMSTRGRMELAPGQVSSWYRGAGWSWIPMDDNLVCYCETDGEPESFYGIVIQGERQTGQRMTYTGRFDPSAPSENPNGAPIYVWATCPHCQGTGRRRGFDWESGGHPFFDGMRISNDGTRLMATQPHKPKHADAPRTESGYDLGAPRRGIHAYW